MYRMSKSPVFYLKDTVPDVISDEFMISLVSFYLENGVKLFPY